MTTPMDRIRHRPTASAPYTFAYDPEDAQRISEAAGKVEEAAFQVERQPKSPTVKKEHAAAIRALKKLQAEVVTVTTTFEAIGTSALEEIQNDCPPTEAQQTEAAETLEEGQHLMYNPDLFGPTAAAASLTRLEFSDDKENAATKISFVDAVDLWKGLSQFDRLEILSLITVINTRSSQVALLGKD